MGSPSRNVQYHPPRLSEDRLNLAQPHSPSLPTHCSGKSGMRPAQLQQPHGHHYEVALHGLAVNDPCVVDGRVDLRFPFGDFAVPGDVDVAQRPGVLERRAGCLRPDRRLVVLVAVERRVGVDEVDALGVQAAQDVEVVPRPHGAVGEVRGRSAGHDRRLSTSGRSDEFVVRTELPAVSSAATPWPSGCVPVAPAGQGGIFECVLELRHVHRNALRCAICCSSSSC